MTFPLEKIFIVIYYFENNQKYCNFRSMYKCLGLLCILIISILLHQGEKKKKSFI